MKSNRNSGQISIFLSIVFTSLIFSAFIAIDIARISIAEKQAARAVEYAGKSALTKYSSYIKENFGLFAIRAEVPELEETVRDYITANLGIENSRNGALLYDFRIESITVTPMNDLTENDVVRKQILEYMKYRGLKEIAGEFINKLDAAKDTSKMTALYSEKTMLDAAWGKADKVLADLNGIITGTGGIEKFCVNAFNSGDSRTIMTGEIADKIICHRSLEAEIEQLKSELAAISGNQNEENNSGEISVSQISALQKHIAQHEKEISDTRLRILYLWGIFKQEHTQQFLSANLKALECLGSGEKLIAAAQTLGDSLKTLMAMDEYCGGQLLGDLKTEISAEIDAVNEVVAGEERLSEIKEDLEANIEYLKNLNGIIGKYDTHVMTAFDIPGDKDAIMLSLGGSESYCYIDYSYTHTVSETVAGDPRESAEENVRQNYSGDSGGSNSGEGISDPAHYGISPEMLPSKNKTENADEEPDTGGAGNIANDVDFDDSGDFSRSAFDFWGSLGKALKDGFEALRNELYINEYIIDMFGNVSRSAAGNGIFGGEVEYILHGKMRDKDNCFLTKAEILLARFGLNTLHVYMDTEKKALSTAIATTVAGWWTGGAGIPIISNLIRCGWGMSEAVVDMENLTEGKPVALHKQKGDWVLQIGLPGSDAAYKKSSLQFTYEDYLRLLLLTVSEDIKISRIEDLICMNLAKNGRDFKIKDYCTGINIEAVISVNYTFISRILKGGMEKTADGRHLIKVAVYEGY